LLAYVIIRRIWRWRWASTAALLVPLLFIDVAFFSSNLLKVPEGAWVPLAMGGSITLLVWIWTKGNAILSEKTRREAVPLVDLLQMLQARAPYRVPGTAIFLTADPDTAPVALMHNLKHNKVLHEKNVLLTVRTAETPRVSEEDRIQIEPLSADFKKVYLTYGFMESPNVPKALGLCRKKGLKFDIMSTSFFLGRRSVVPSAQSGMPLWQDKIYIFLLKNAANPTEFFRIPPGRVVELGAQVSV
jgi:KUP system potassium uptake protein